jgi:class 3 adenylate cyclase
MIFRIEVEDILKNTSEFHSLNAEEIRFGRASGLEVPISNKYISKYHATVRPDGKGLFVRDEGSSNGTEIYSNYRWRKIGEEGTQAGFPVRMKLAGAVVVTIQSGESQIVSLSDVESDASIMVLDICNSTGQAVKDEQIAFHLKQRLNQIAKPILYSSPMQFYKNTGDGFLATFSGSTQAVNAAIKILKTLEKRNRKTKNPPINVRVALHEGATYMIDPATEDIHGIDINITFRIEGIRKSAFSSLKRDIGRENRILASEALYREYRKRTRRKKEIFSYCGAAKLKGIRDKMPIYRLDWEG